jgi:sphinganine-1-phosphate aldolase
MDIIKIASKVFGLLPSRAVKSIETGMGKIPALQGTLEGQYDSILGDIGDSLKPYREEFTTHTQLPETGIERDKILQDMAEFKAREESKWQDGFVSGAVYHGDSQHIDFLNKVYALHSQSNPLHSDLWPSSSKFEAEIVSMTANMLGASQTEDEICGTVSSGGTESILLAMKTYRDRARDQKGVRNPEMIAPSSAHVAFDKAAEYFGIKMVRIPVGPDFRADVEAARQAITKNTIVIIGSAPGFPHGVIDPIEELSNLALEHGIGFHTDGCLGGFVIPWIEKLGHDMPVIDFRLPGVTSISADTHKFGYASKGTSVVLYRGLELRRYQYYTATDWPGGLYFSPTIAGSRPGGLSAACWAGMISMGEQGYMNATARILETATTIKKGIEGIDELYVLGDPLWVIAFGAKTLDIYKIMDYMSERGWSLNGLYKPECVHICVTLRNTQSGVAERFIADLKTAVEHVRTNPHEEGKMAPVYGMAANIPMRGMVSELLKRYVDLLYKT